VAWAYLKEELVNTPDSAEVTYLRQHFPNLIDFVHYMDMLLAGVQKGDLVLPHQLLWNAANDNARIINSFLQKTRFESADRFITVPKGKKKANNAEEEDTPEGDRQSKEEK
jgi:hypothetical protein